MLEKMISRNRTCLESMRSPADLPSSTERAIGVSGALVFMALMALFLASNSVRAQNLHSNIPPPVLPDGVGLNIHFVNGASMWSNRANFQDATYGPIDRHMLDMIAAAGFKYLRVDMYWEDIETTKGVYDWAPWDTLVSETAIVLANSD